MSPTSRGKFPCFAPQSCMTFHDFARLCTTLKDSVSGVFDAIARIPNGPSKNLLWERDRLPRGPEDWKNSIPIEIFNLAWKFQYRLKISISTLRIPHKNRGLVGGSLLNISRSWVFFFQFGPLGFLEAPFRGLCVQGARTCDSKKCDLRFGISGTHKATVAGHTFEKFHKVPEIHFRLSFRNPTEGNLQSQALEIKVSTSTVAALFSKIAFWQARESLW